MSDHRLFFVITSHGEAGPFTLEALRDEVAAQRIDRNDRLRTAFGANLGTVGEAVGPAPRNQRKPSDPRMPTPEGSSTQRAASAQRGRTSNRNPPIAVRPATRSTIPWLPLAILGGVMALGLGAMALRKSPPVADSSTPTTASTETTPAPLPTSIQPPIPAPQPAPNPPNHAYEHEPQTIPGTILVWRFDQDGEGVGYHDQDKENHGHCQIRAGTGVDLSQYGGSSDIWVSYVAEEEWLAFTCNIASAGRYRWTFSASRDAKIIAKPAELLWTLNGRRLGPPVSIADTGSFRQFQKFSGEVDLPAGLQVLHLYAQRGGTDYGDITFTKIPSATP